MKRTSALALILAAVLMRQGVCDATMFTIKFSTNDIKISSDTEISLKSQFDYYPIWYTMEGNDPAFGEVYDTPLRFESGAYKLMAGVFTEDGEAISDTYIKYIVNGVSSNAIQTDQSRIIYEDYTEVNKRYPYYAFDGDSELGNIAKSWSFSAMPVTVTYAEPIKANMCLITTSVSNNALSWFANGTNSNGTRDTKKEKTTDDISINLDIRYKDKDGNYVSALNDGYNAVMPKGSEVTYRYAYDRGVVWATFAFDLDKFTSDEIIFDFKGSKNIGIVKEIELYEANARDYAVKYVPTNAKMSAGEEIALSANLREGEYITYTTDGSNPTWESEIYSEPLIMENEEIVTIKSAVFDENGELLSDVFENTYIVGEHEMVGVQTDALKISGTESDVAKAFDGDNAMTSPVHTATALSRTNEIVSAAVEYDEPITTDTLAVLTTLNESKYLENVSAGANGTNSDGTKGEKEEILIKDLSVDIRVDYLKDGELTEGEWKTVTLYAGSPCRWNWTVGYGRAWVYLPAVKFEEVTTTKLVINIRNFAEDNTNKIWKIKEFELYSSNN